MNLKIKSIDFSIIAEKLKKKLKILTTTRKNPQWNIMDILKGNILSNPQIVVIIS